MGVVRHQKPVVMQKTPQHGNVRGLAVGGTGFEPATSSVSRKRATTAPTALGTKMEVATGFEPVWTALQAAASPLGHATNEAGIRHRGCCLRADDGTRTRDPHLGKVMRYQLRYIRMRFAAGSTLAHAAPIEQTRRAWYAPRSYISAGCNGWVKLVNRVGRLAQW